MTFIENSIKLLHNPNAWAVKNVDTKMLSTFLCSLRNCIIKDLLKISIYKFFPKPVYVSSLVCLFLKYNIVLDQFFFLQVLHHY